MGSHLRVIQRLNDGESLGRSKLISFFGLHADLTAPDDDGLTHLCDAAEDYGYLALEDRPTFLLTRPFTLDQRNGLTLTTERFPNTNDVAPSFYWGGDKGAPMIVMNRCLNVTLDGFCVVTDDFARKRSPAGLGILLDGGHDTGPGAQIGGSCMLTRLRHVTFPDTNGVCDVAATFIAIARTAKQNQEFHRIDGCAGNGNGRGTFLQLGPSYNVKDIMLRDSRYIERYDKAVKIDNGSLVMVSNNMSGNEWDVWAGAGNSSVGYVREFFHIGEHSRHHAFVNMPYYAVGGTYDTQDMRPRSTVLPDPVYTRDLPDYRDYEECWILFGVHCPEATIEHTTISSMLNPAARVFGFMNNGAFSRVTIGPNYLGRNHTMSTLGLDEPSLQKLVGRPKVVFRDRATDVNLAGPGIQGLPSGEFTFNDRGVVYARNPDLTPMESTRIVVGDAPKAWNQIGRGETHFYRTDKQLMFRHVDADGRRKQGVVGAETVVTDQEKDGHS